MILFVIEVVNSIENQSKTDDIVVYGAGTTFECACTSGGKD